MNNGKTGIIIDYETMSPDAINCAVIDCSVMTFSWDKFVSDNPYTIEDIKFTKRFKLSIVDQVKNYDYQITKSTLDFWAEQDSEVKAKIKPKPNDLTVKEYVEKFLSYLKAGPKISHYWSRSNTFDPIILTRLFKSQDKLQDLEKILKFWAVRDTRTWIDAKLDFPKDNGFCPFEDTVKWNKTFKKHDSSWDVLADVLRLQAIARAENDLEQVKL